MRHVSKWVPCDGIAALTIDELNNPIGVLKSFCADFQLLAIKELFSTMTDLCVMAEDVCAPEATGRQHLFALSTRFTKVLEAVYLIVRKDDAVPENDEQPETPEFRTIRVCRSRHALDNPALTFSGKWLYDAGFHIGDEVQIAIERGRLVLTVSRRWSRDAQQWCIRA